LERFGERKEQKREGRRKMEEADEHRSVCYDGR
jgi:hypothetical protein